MPVVERCPSCGVEHDARADECEACHTALRYWCRAHSRETGWLDSAECRRCAEEEALRRPPAPAPSPAAPRVWRTGPVVGEVTTAESLWGLAKGLVTVVGTGFAGWLLGIMVGGVLAMRSGGDVDSWVAQWGTLACGAGLVLGLGLAIRNSSLYASDVHDSAER